MRYVEHQKSIKHAEKAQNLIKMQIAQALETNLKHSPNDYQFLIDIAGLIIAARRSLSYTYAIRFFLTGANRQAFFDFIQGDLEKSLEALNKKMEDNWLNHVEYDTQGKMVLSQKFIRFKENVTSLREVVERHFNYTMKEIMLGLPSIPEEEKKDETDYTFDGSNTGQNWTCRVCQVKNPMANAKCSTCQAAKPSLTFKIGNAASQAAGSSSFGGVGNKKKGKKGKR